MEHLDGILPVYKDEGMTSHDVIYCLRRILGQKKIGHTGTLDPMASGLLLVCLGRATKLTQFLSDWDKAYLAELTLGQTSDTLDGEGQLSAIMPVPDLTESDILGMLDKFTGRIVQKVPAYSAVKVAGKELYKYARKGVDVETPEREVTIEKIDLISYTNPLMQIEVSCGKGTYIRTLADDIGREIGCGAYLSGLKRIRVASHTIEKALSIAEVELQFKAGKLHESILSMAEMLSFPMISVNHRAVETIRHGGIPEHQDIIDCQGSFIPGDLISMADEYGEILAIGKSKCSDDAMATVDRDKFFSYVRVLI
ncbi:MAG: tRNA pseudouridine(55) synthase TruB [candidate division Zixibacteria bacterium]|nr:tRNA pseudouridine(55) synthase TruB [candidate division Zixibacteria bacterium]